MISIKQATLTTLFAYTATAIQLQESDDYDYVDELAEAIAEKLLYTNDENDEFVDLT